ncbi:amidohydrolase family protein [Steroidobacter flavus]|uniref:Amidohydrolase family protein n=1 Tax=Steroidobacter flavus TaxID=1842136 RepID=A0ABV8T2E2_9GAMM
MRLLLASRSCAVVLMSLGMIATAAGAEYDVVYTGARAIDPETGLDEVRNIGIAGGKIAAVSTDRLKGRRTIDARGLVAAPGFIDLHSHSTTLQTAKYQAKDGVTTRLELEAGAFPVQRWYEQKAGKELLNYGASVSHNKARFYLLNGGDDRAMQLLQSDPLISFRKDIHTALPAEQRDRLIVELERGMKAGAIGIGSGPQYAPGIDRWELLDVTRLSARMRTCVFTHIRYGSLIEPGSTLESIQENVANVAITGGCVHIMHLNSMGMSASPELLKLIHGARDRGLDVSTETYPWGASSDSIRSVIFDPGWEQRWGVGPEDLQSTSTGKRLTREEFDALRSGTGKDGVLMHMNTEETLVALLRDPSMIVVSDAGNLEAGKLSHPRTVGSFARVLGHYVREAGVLTLSDAIAKMSLKPAQRLEAFVPAMKHKGRLQVGADADVVFFDPATVREKATYLDAMQYSEGFQYVMIDGVLVVDRGKLIENVFPGQPLHGQYGE